ncbi:MAG: ORF6N domain-containing protein [Steroidobacteraceae bacterium]
MPEWAVLRSQSVTSKLQHGGRRYTPYVFTEQGVAMLSSVLNSERAIAINIEIMRAFVKLRDLLSSNRELARRFAQLETRLDKKLTEHDQASPPSSRPSASSWEKQQLLTKALDLVSQIQLSQPQLFLRGLKNPPGRRSSISKTIDQQSRHRDRKCHPEPQPQKMSRSRCD